MIDKCLNLNELELILKLVICATAKNYDFDAVLMMKGILGVASFGGACLSASLWSLSLNLSKLLAVVLSICTLLAAGKNPLLQSGAFQAGGPEVQRKISFPPA